MNKNTRREFLKLTAAGAAGFALSQGLTFLRKSPKADYSGGMAGKPGSYSAKPNDPSEIRFLVLGDWGWAGVKSKPGEKDTGKLSFDQAVDAEELGEVAASRHADFVLSVGDNFYPNGVTSVEDKRWHDSFETIYQDASLQVPWYVALGNHDYRGSVSAQVEYSKKSTRWRMPARYYSVPLVSRDESLSVELFVLDTNPFISTYRHGAYSDIKDQDTSAQVAWLEHRLTQSTARHKIVVGHHPLWTGGVRRDLPHERVSDWLDPILRKHGVRAYFCGHEHDAQHLEVDGLHCFVHGNGSEARPTGVIPATHFAESRLGFGYVEMSQDRIRVHFIDGLGELRHSAEIPLV